MMTAVPVTPPRAACPVCRRAVPLLVEGSDLCLRCDSLIPNPLDPGGDVMVTGHNPTYISAEGHRPIPLASDNIRRPHTPAKAKPTGLDWDKLRPAGEQPPAAAVEETAKPCRNCCEDTPPSELHDGWCAVCRDLAAARFEAPAYDPKPRRPQPPGWVHDVVTVLLDTENHPHPDVRAARKVVANALVALNKTLRLSATPAPAAAVTSTPTAAAGKTRRHGKSTLTDEQWAEVARRYEAGESQAALGLAYGVSQHTVSVHLRKRGVATRPANFRKTAQ